jgi:acetyl-CoA carboxylase carboxyl transferase subunit alpha
MPDKPSKRPEPGASGMAFERPIQALEAKLAELEALALRTRLDISSEIEALRKQHRAALEQTYRDLSAWETVNVARHAERPVAFDYIEHMLDEFVELSGDKYFGDDKAIVTGLATMGGRRFMLIAHRKGKTTKERLACNFGCAHPEGYRKALRKMKLAEKLRLPVVTLINTPGAYPGIGAEERGQAAAIAENILAMMSIATPIVAIVIGEGGSGGALGIGVGDRVLMMAYAYYSVISPEGCAAILWKDGERTADAAEALRLTSKDLLQLGLIDGVIPEPLGGAHRAPTLAMDEVKRTILRELAELDLVPVRELVRLRRRKFRSLGLIPGRFPSLEIAGQPARQQAAAGDVAG